ncbi:hypothetical protein Tco_0996902 [Tanacetum coccineum]
MFSYSHNPEPVKEEEEKAIEVVAATETEVWLLQHLDVVESCQSIQKVSLYLKTSKDAMNANVPRSFLRAVLGHVLVVVFSTVIHQARFGLSSSLTATLLRQKTEQSQLTRMSNFKKLRDFMMWKLIGICWRKGLWEQNKVRSGIDYAIIREKANIKWNKVSGLHSVSHPVIGGNTEMRHNDQSQHKIQNREI